MALPQGMDTDLLRAFVLIAEGHSFTQAAARVGRTQSAVSMQVKRLEEMLGQPVLSRSKGGAVELHLYEHGGHGFGYPGRKGTSTTQWPSDFLAWLKARGLLGTSG